MHISSLHKMKKTRKWIYLYGLQKEDIRLRALPLSPVRLTVIIAISHSKDTIVQNTDPLYLHPLLPKSFHFISSYIPNRVSL